MAVSSPNRLGSARHKSSLLFRLLLLLEVFFLAGDVCRPIEAIDLDVHRAEGGVVVFDEPLCPSVGCPVGFLCRKPADDHSLCDEEQAGDNPQTAHETPPGRATFPVGMQALHVIGGRIGLQ